MEKIEAFYESPYGRELVAASRRLDLQDPKVSQEYMWLNLHGWSKEGTTAAAWYAAQMLIAAGRLGIKPPPWAVDLVDKIFANRLTDHKATLDEAFGFTKPGRGAHKGVPVYQVNLAVRNAQLAYDVFQLRVASEVEGKQMKLEEAIDRVAYEFGQLKGWDKTCYHLGLVHSTKKPRDPEEADRQAIRRVYYAWAKEHRDGLMKNPDQRKVILKFKTKILARFPPRPE